MERSLESEIDNRMEGTAVVRQEKKCLENRGLNTGRVRRIFLTERLRDRGTLAR